MLRRKANSLPPAGVIPWQDSAGPGPRGSVACPPGPGTCRRGGPGEPRSRPRGPGRQRVTSRDFPEGKQAGKEEKPTGGARLSAGSGGRGCSAGWAAGTVPSSSAGKSPSGHGPGSFPAFWGKAEPEWRTSPFKHKQGRNPHVSRWGPAALRGAAGSPGSGGSGGRGGHDSFAASSQLLGRFHPLGKGLGRVGVVRSFFFFPPSLSARRLAAPGSLEGGGKGRWCGFLPRLRGEDCVPLLIKRSPRKMVSDMR